MSNKVSKYPGQAPKQQAQTQISTLVAASYHTGPLPPAAEMELYCKIIPDGGDRLMRMAEEQSKLRTELDRTVVNAKIKLDTRGQIFGFVIGLAGFGVGALLVLKGHEVAGGAFFTTTLVGLVYAFVTGRTPKKPKE